MQEPQTTNPPTPIDRFRQWIKTLVGNTFSAPYLPILLTVFYITTVITHLAVVLMSQPLSYWNNPQNAVGLGMFGEKLSMGAVPLIVLTIIYLVIGTLLLSFMNYRWSFIGWLTAEFLHFFLIQEMISNCYISRWSVLFGGVCQSMDDGLFWVIGAIVVGILLVFTFQPAEFSLENKKIQKGISYTSGFIPVVWIVVLVIGVILSAQKPAYGWVPVEVKNGPGPLREAESAYDIKRNRLVMFGGQESYIGNEQWNYKTDTWEWDGNQWINMPSQKVPQGRADHGMAYDEKRGVTVLFGGVNNGQRLSDTWEWDGKSWKEINPPNYPSMRSGHEMIYDQVREKIIMYGGYGNDIFYNDAWEWDGKNWTWIPLESGAPTASVFALAYDPNQNYAFGFLSGTGGTWHWEENTWTRFYPEIEPSNRGWSTLVYDPIRELFFIFGGYSQDIWLNDTWTYNGSEWKEFTSSGVKPSARADMVVWYDPIREHVMLFGGYGADAIYNDTWEFIPPEE
ncbi:MAG: hypothetical protein H7Y59_10380 [Anaerolineales bacterium]|nr:hypothetical protein [Anaerolineales bacterium]